MCDYLASFREEPLWVLQGISVFLQHEAMSRIAACSHCVTRKHSINSVMCGLHALFILNPRLLHFRITW